MADEMQSTISVKLNNNGELRRFGFSMDGAELYPRLVEKVQSMTSFTGNLAWKDEDGDLIVFSTDDELKEAIRAATDGVLRIVVVEKMKKGNQAEGAEKQPVAPETPRAKKLEQRHQKLIEKVTKVEERMMAQGGAKKKTPPSPPPTQKEQGTEGDEQKKVHRRVTCDGCDSEIIGSRFKCIVCRDYDLCATCEGKRIHSEHAMIRIANPDDMAWKPVFMWSQRMQNAGPGMGPHGPGMGPHGGFRGFMGPHRFHRGCGRRCGWAQGQGQKDQAQKEKAPTQEGAIPDENPEDGAGVDFDAGIQFLRSVGESVATALGNLGIDVDVDVEHGGRMEKVNPKEISPEEKKEESEQKMEGTLEEAIGGVPMEEEQKKPTETAEKIATPTENSPNAEWTLIDEPVGGNDVSTQMTAPPLQPDITPSPQPLYPFSALPTPHPLTRHQNPVINQALEQMLSMGFTNEADWLSGLLEAKEGDIGATLDSLTPAARRA